MSLEEIKSRQKEVEEEDELERLIKSVRTHIGNRIFKEAQDSGIGWGDAVNISQELINDMTLAIESETRRALGEARRRIEAGVKMR
jgi:hypothetical protein